MKKETKPVTEKHERFLTIEEVAGELRLSRTTVYTLIKEKKLRVTRFGGEGKTGRTFIDRKDLEDFIEKSKS
jgi:excisionase family DNA binding protein